MNLLVERTDGKRIEYPHAARSKVVIEFVINSLRDTAVYYPEDFIRIEVRDRVKSGMTFYEAMQAMLEGKHVKRPEFARFDDSDGKGMRSVYWYLKEDDPFGHVCVYCGSEYPYSGIGTMYCVRPLKKEAQNAS